MRLCQGIHVIFLPSCAEAKQRWDCSNWMHYLLQRRSLHHVLQEFCTRVSVWQRYQGAGLCGITTIHMLGVEIGRWQRLPRAERICQRCSCDAVDDEAHMVWGCAALIDQRVQHSELFQDSNITTVADFLQQDAGATGSFLAGLS